MSYAAVSPLTITKSGNTITAAYTGDAVEGYALILASYNSYNGVLNSLETKPLSNGQSVSLPVENGRAYKAFAMNLGTMEPLCDCAFYGENSYSGTVEAPLVDGTEAKSFTAAIREYTDARLKIEELLELDPTEVEGDSVKLSQYLAKVDEALNAYDDVLTSSAALYYISDKSVTYGSARIPEIENNISLCATKEEQLHWAEELTKQYDSVKGSQKLKQFAQMMGCDAAQAYEQLTAAQDILRGSYMADAKAADNWIKGLTVVKTGCKVALLVGSTIATAGAAGGMLTATEATGLLINSADAVVDVGRTIAVVALGDDSKTVQGYEKFFAPITTTATIFSVLTLGNANEAEKLALFGDLNMTLKEKTGYSLDELTYEYSGGKLMMNVISNNFTKEDFVKFMEDPAQIGSNRYEKLLEGRELLEKNREEITDETMVSMLKEAEILSSDENIDGFDDEKEEFEKLVRTKLKNPDEEEEEPTPTPNNKPTPTPDPTPTPTPKIEYIVEKSGNYMNKYYYNHEINKEVDLYESYFYNRNLERWILTSRKMYDDDGKILTYNSYSSQTGELHEYSTYTDGYNPGSICTTYDYYTSDVYGSEFNLPEGVTEPLRYLYQTRYETELYEGEEIKRLKPYFGEYYEYNMDGTMVEHSTGIEGEWERTEGFDRRGTLSYEYLNNHDGTYTYKSYFTEKPADLKFDPTGHLQVKDIYTNGDAGGICDNGVPNANTSEFVRGEEWMLGGDSILIENDDGIVIGYTIYYGYNHYFDSTPDYDDGVGRGKYNSPYTNHYYNETEFERVTGGETHYIGQD